ncbi:hypothetical protein N7478_009287 [Penicillium angulare]|uniref:uncharacterized protein n=1 Tax=Penicillium angulare TaxID=116970 RepID=UPI002541377C|nr:uncharacterized protein N7478_009287 [Penicillium angulare]KAJ5266479.1 hypothetical protein N7478_009287 [Penicillium angulare]
MHRWISRSVAGAPVFYTLKQSQCTTIRQASLNSAIGRGIRRSQPRPSAQKDLENTDRRSRPRREDAQPPFSKSNSDREPRQYRKPREDRYKSDSHFDQNEFIRSGNFRALPREHQSRWESSPREDKPRWQSSPREDKPRWESNPREDKPRWQSSPREDKPRWESNPREDKPRWQSSPREDKPRWESNPREDNPRWQSSRPRDENWSSKPTYDKPKSPNSRSRAHRITETMPERVKGNVKVPDSIPYTTPASEFIYGTSAVEAALRCSRRQIYKLYVYQGAGEELSPAKMALRKLALTKNIAIKLAFAGWDRLMDKMSAGRPHNGCILEASPLPKLPVRALNPVQAATDEHFSVELAPQTREEAAVNGTNNQLAVIQAPVSSGGEKASRFPVALLLDGIVDTGNMGAIIRSAYYLGIDAIILAGRNSAPLSPITIKASAGAAENMTLLHVRNEVDFIQRSQANGWKFYAADAPGPGATSLSRAEPGDESNSGSLLATQAPSVLMMGSEGSGLSAHIKSHADAIVSIAGARHGNELGVQSDPARIDSLNVSVASALLMEMFLRTPLLVSEPTKRAAKQNSKMW